MLGRFKLRNLARFARHKGRLALLSLLSLASCSAQSVPVHDAAGDAPRDRGADLRDLSPLDRGGVDAAGRDSDSSPTDHGPGDKIKIDLDQPAGCGYALPPYSGPLCGPAANACKLQENQVLSSKPAQRSAGPSITLSPAGQPRILFSETTLSNKGYYGALTKVGTWSVTSTPMDISVGAMVTEATGTILANIYDGSTKGGGLHRFDGSAWSSVATINPGLGTYTSGMSGWVLALDSGGCVHTLLADLGSSLTYLRLKGTSWTATQLSSLASTFGAPLALSWGGIPHVAYWSAAGSAGWKLYVQQPGLAEQVTILGSNTLIYKTLSLVVPGGGSGSPQVFFNRVKPGTTGLQLSHAVRGSSGWTVTPLFDHGPDPCSATCIVGSKCTYDYSFYWPLAAVTSGTGSVRLLMARRRHFGTKVGISGPYPLPCSWSGGSVDGEVQVVWLVGGKVMSSTLLSGAVPQVFSPGSAVLDTYGAIHLALYTLSVPYAAPYHSEVRYLKIAP